MWPSIGGGPVPSVHESDWGRVFVPESRRGRAEAARVGPSPAASASWPSAWRRGVDASDAVMEAKDGRGGKGVRHLRGADCARGSLRCG